MFSSGAVLPAFRSAELQRTQPKVSQSVGNTEAASINGSPQKLSETQSFLVTERTKLKERQPTEQTYDVKKEIQELRQLERKLLDELYEKRHMLMMGMKVAQQSTSSSKPIISPQLSQRIPTDITEPMNHNMSFRKMVPPPQRSPVIPIFNRPSLTTSPQKSVGKQRQSAQMLSEPQVHSQSMIVHPERSTAPINMHFSLGPPNTGPSNEFSADMNGNVTLRNNYQQPAYDQQAYWQEQLRQLQQQKRQSRPQRRPTNDRLETQSDDIQFGPRRRDSYTSIDIDEDNQYDTYLRLQQNKVSRQRLSLNRINRQINHMNESEVIRPRMSLHERERPILKERSESVRQSVPKKERKNRTTQNLRARFVDDEPSSPLKSTVKGSVQQKGSSSRQKDPSERFAQVNVGITESFLDRSNKSALIEREVNESVRPNRAFNKVVLGHARRSSQPTDKKDAHGDTVLMPSQNTTMLEAEVVDNTEATRFMYLLCESIQLEGHVEKFRNRLSPVIEDALDILGVGSAQHITHRKFASNLVEIIRGGRSFGLREMEEFVHKLFPKGTKINHQHVLKLLSPAPHSPRSSRKRAPQDEEQINELLYQLFCSLMELSYFEECLVEHASNETLLIEDLFERMSSGQTVSQFDLVNYLRSHTNTVVTVDAVELFLDRRLQKNSQDTYDKSELLGLFVR